MPALEERHLVAILACIVLDADKVGIAMRSRTPCISSSITCPFMVSAHFSTKPFVYFLLSTLCQEC